MPLLPHSSSWRGALLTKHRDNFAFYCRVCSTLRDWLLNFTLSYKRDPPSSYATAGIARFNQSVMFSVLPPMYLLLVTDAQ
jgi:hypothetical protein